MERYRLRNDLPRVVIDGFALPLGIAPGDFIAPTQGYTIEFASGESEDPDTYAFYVAASHERVAPLLRSAFDLLLPGVVSGVIEIGSRDAYRLIDVYVSGAEITREQFLDAWHRYEPVLLEDGSIAAGANSESPFVEVFVDQWKGVSIVVPLSMRDEVESLLQSFDLQEVAQTWPVGEDNPGLADAQIRPVLTSDNGSVDIDDVLLRMRRDWQLELNVDPHTNVDAAGRRLGLTLWHAVVGLESVLNGRLADGSIWATAGSLTELDGLIEEALRSEPYMMTLVYSTDRVAFDERPEELSDLPPRRKAPEVHLVSIEPRRADAVPRHG